MLFTKSSLKAFFFRKNTFDLKLTKWMRSGTINFTMLIYLNKIGRVIKAGLSLMLKSRLKKLFYQLLVDLNG
jgi:hypothetical protein